MAVSEVCAEIMLMKQMMEFLQMKVNLPILVNMDNVGAIYLASNATSGQRTRHIDVRYHFVRNYVEEGIVKIVFVQSKENDADMFTKNVGEQDFIKHSEKFMEENKRDFVD